MPTRVRDVSAATAVPAFGLYGEHGVAVPDLLHWESIGARSRLHDWRIAPHRHDELAQLLYVQRGPATVHLDGRTQRIGGATVIWLPPMCVHGFNFDPRVRGHIATLCMPLVHATVQGAPALRQVLASPQLLAAGRSRPLLDLVFASIADDHARQRIGREAAMQAAAAQLLVWCARTALEKAHDHAITAAHADPGLRHLRSFQALIDVHYRAHWSIARYAAQVGLTPGHLNAVCQRLANASALQLLQRRLMLEARRSLRYTSMSVQQVAADLGFFDAAYFSRFFARHAGCSPSHFRAAG